MPLNIRNPQADQLAAEVARMTGETKTQAVIAALQERLARVQRARERSQREQEAHAAEITALTRTHPIGQMR